MQQHAVVLSDLFLSIFCFVFAWKLWAKPAERRQLNWNFFGLFSAIGVASFMGGVFHGYLEDGSTDLSKFVWIGTLICVGVSAYNLWLIDLYLVVGDGLFSKGRRVFRILFVVYLVLVIFVVQKFWVAILAYMPPAMTLFMILSVRTMRERNRYLVFGLVGLALTFLAGYIQHFRIGMHPVYMNHNTLYHLVQILGLWGVYLFGSRYSRWHMD